MPDEFLYEQHGRVAIMTFNRPEKHNACTPRMFEDMTEAFTDFAGDEGLWVAILTGAGDSAFCAGADLGETVTRITSGGPRSFRDITKRFLSDIYKPIIGAVNGHCIAAGLEILQGTDLRLAAEHATFGLGEVRWGITPAGGSHVRLPRQIPWAVAMELLLTGRPIDARRAYEVGLVNRVVPAGDLMDEALALAESLCENAPLAVRTAKEIAVRGMELETPFVIENVISQRVLQTKDAMEGPQAFSENRKPDYRGH